jgi:predicted O-linked N-acetylglucosamine transferase (SPINDLY family)
MGVPIVTLAGEPTPSRYSASFLTAVGLSDWVTANTQDFIRLAVEKSTDTKRLAEIRRDLRRRMKASALMDEPGLIQYLETAYEHLWKEWLTKHLPKR